MVVVGRPAGDVGNGVDLDNRNGAVLGLLREGFGRPADHGGAPRDIAGWTGTGAGGYCHLCHSSLGEVEAVSFGLVDSMFRGALNRLFQLISPRKAQNTK